MQGVFVTMNWSAEHDSACLDKNLSCKIRPSGDVYRGTQEGTKNKILIDKIKDDVIIKL